MGRGVGLEGFRGVHGVGVGGVKRVQSIRLPTGTLHPNNDDVHDNNDDFTLEVTSV